MCYAGTGPHRRRVRELGAYPEVPKFASQPTNQQTAQQHHGRETSPRVRVRADLSCVSAGRLVLAVTQIAGFRPHSSAPIKPSVRRDV